MLDSPLLTLMILEMIPIGTFLYVAWMFGNVFSFPITSKWSGLSGYVPPRSSSFIIFLNCLFYSFLSTNSILFLILHTCLFLIFLCFWSCFFLIIHRHSCFCLFTQMLSFLLLGYLTMILLMSFLFLLLPQAFGYVPPGSSSLIILLNFLFYTYLRYCSI